MSGNSFKRNVTLLKVVFIVVIIATTGCLAVNGALAADAIPPSVITDLGTSQTSSTSITLIWTAPGNDGDQGTATGYELRYFTTGPLTDQTWSLGTVVTGVPSPQAAGSSESFLVTGLTAGTRYWFGIRTTDGTNWSEISNSPANLISNLGQCDVWVFNQYAYGERENALLRMIQPDIVHRAAYEWVGTELCDRNFDGVKPDMDKLVRNGTIWLSGVSGAWWAPDFETIGPNVNVSEAGYGPGCCYLNYTSPSGRNQIIYKSKKQIDNGSFGIEIDQMNTTTYAPEILNELKAYAQNTYGRNIYCSINAFYYSDGADYGLDCYPRALDANNNFDGSVNHINEIRALCSSKSKPIYYFSDFAGASTAGPPKYEQWADYIRVGDAQVLAGGGYPGLLRNHQNGYSAFELEAFTIQANFFKFLRENRELIHNLTFINPSTLNTTSSNVFTSAFGQAGRTIVHLVNGNYNSSTQAMSTQTNFTLDVSLAAAPAKVWVTTPDRLSDNNRKRDLSFTYSNGVAAINVDELQYHDIVVIEQTNNYYSPVYSYMQIQFPWAAPKYLYTGNKFKYTALQTEGWSQKFDWYVNGIYGGNSTYGTIDSEGVYTAPSTVPAGDEVTIKAVSKDSSSVYKEITQQISEAPSMPFSESFTNDTSGKAPQNWQIVDGKGYWKVDTDASEKVLHNANLLEGRVERGNSCGSGYPEGGAMTDTLIVTGNPSWTDYTYSVDIKSAKDYYPWYGIDVNPESIVGLVFLYKDSKNYYVYQWQSNNTLTLYKYVNGIPMKMGGNVPGLAPTTAGYTNFKVVVKGNTFAAYQGNTHLRTDSDTNVSGGCVGLTTALTENYFKNITVSASDDVTLPCTIANLAYGKDVTISGNMGGSYLTDGKVDYLQKWYSDTVPQWASVDLLKSRTINCWVVRHAYTAYEPAIYNTADYKLQKSDNGIDWTDVDSVTGNTANSTTRYVIPFTARYVRLYVTKANFNHDDDIRIYEFEVWGPSSGNILQDSNVSISAGMGGVYLTDGTVSNGIYNKWWTSTVPQSASIDLGKNYKIDRWVVKHAEAGGELSIYNTADFKLQSSNDGINWTDIDTVIGNTSAITDRSVAEFTARYVRLYVSKANNNHDICARIFEFEVYGTSSLESANLSMSKSVSISAGMGGNNLTDGSVSGGVNYKWWTATVPQTASIDLGQNCLINRWIVKHAQAGGESSTYNTADFKLQKSNDGVNWTDVDSVTGNTAAATDRSVTPFIARYVRLYVSKANANVDGCIRIYEFEVWGGLSNNLAYNKGVSFSQGMYGEMLTDGLTTTPKWWTSSVPATATINLSGFYTMNRWVVKHASAGGEPSFHNTADFKLQRSDDGVNWFDVDSITGNTSGITDRMVPAFTAKYARLYVSKANPGADNSIRIYEFEVWGNPSELKCNLAVGAPVTISSQSGGVYLTDGFLSGGVQNRWYASSAPQSVYVDFGKKLTIERWVVKHAQMGGESSIYNTADFKLQKSDDGINWTDVDSVTDNTAAITDRYVTPFSARYVRLYVSKGNLNSDNSVRIYELELWGNKG